MTTATRHAEKLKRARRRRIRSGDIVIVLVLLGLVIAGFNYASLPALIDLIYNPVAGLILLIIIIEFIWLKSGDRTRVYAIEIDRLRTQRRKDEDLLRRAREVIDQGLKSPDSEEKGRPGDWHHRAVDINRDIDERL